MSNLNKSLPIFPSGNPGLPQQEWSRANRTPAGDTEGVSHTNPPWKNEGLHVGQRNHHLQLRWLLKSHSIMNALYRHSDTEKGNNKETQRCFISSPCHLNLLSTVTGTGEGTY